MWTHPALALLRATCADVRKDAESGDPLWNETWSALHFLCPENLLLAAEILDTKTVTRVVARTNRRAYFLVDGQSRGKTHTVMPGFCTCWAYCMNVANRPDHLACKHELAVQLAEPLGKLHERELDDAEWSRSFSHDMTAPMIEYDPQLAVGDSATSQSDALLPQPVLPRPPALMP